MAGAKRRAVRPISQITFAQGDLGRLRRVLMAKKKIILVDDSPANLTVCKKLLKDLYDVFPVPSAEKMFDLLLHVFPDLILLDVEMPETNGYEAMQKLKAHEAYKDIPVIFLSAMDDAQSEIEGLSLGAVDYIHKPFIGSVLIRRIEMHLAVVEGKQELLALNNSIKALMAQDSDNVGQKMESEEETINELLTKGNVLTRMGHEIRAPLNTIIDMIESSITSNDINHIKHCLGVANTESRLILEIVNNTLDSSAIG
jgi:DNA-binding response OmpR family regulator